MATRPVFLPCFDNYSLVKVYDICFDWHPGFSIQQKQKSILSLHKNANTELKTSNLLDISTKSLDEIGVSASAFNLMIPDLNGSTKYSVESAFQSAKKFEHGGPYTDIRKMPSRDAKSDLRIRNSGRLISFNFFGNDWGLNPQTAFYDWLYINALYLNKNIFTKMLDYDGFTDIEFNPKKSINCQARSAAIFISLYKTADIDIDKILSSKDNFLSVYKKISYSKNTNKDVKSLLNR